MHPKSAKNRVFPTAREDAHAADLKVDSPQSRSASYRLAYLDDDLMLRDELRPVRLQLELLKAELVQHEMGIESTVVVFGSGRIPDPETAVAELVAAKARLKGGKSDPQLKKRLRRAQRDVKRSRYYEEARRLAGLISINSSRDRLVVVTGGGRGIMEAANRGAHESGCQSIGLNIVLPFEQAPNRFITPELSFQFHYFGIRKMHFLLRAKSLVFFPGGYGTLDELFETLTLIQTVKIKPIPVLLFGRKFWEKIIDFDALVEEGNISAADVDIFTYVETAEEAWEIIARFEVPA
ncbi:MAG: LOG family protein [Desulfobacterales bacterium]